jgi:hypothetical protein
LRRDPANQELLGKYQDLKARLVPDTAAEVPPPAIAVQVAVEPEVAPPTIPHGLRVIQSLERLLEAVRRRREHVQ